MNSLEPRLSENIKIPDTYEDIFVGDSEMARLLRVHDWTATPLGSPQHWPHGLKVALRLLLTSKFEMWLGWGPDIHFFYNDAYRPTLGNKHPRSIAMPTRELWAEIWGDIKGRLETVYQKGEATWDRALLLILERAGYPEESYHTFSYSPCWATRGRSRACFARSVRRPTGSSANGGWNRCASSHWPLQALKGMRPCSTLSRRSSRATIATCPLRLSTC